MSRELQSTYLSLSSALTGFLLARDAAGYSPRTLETYELYIKQFIEFAKDRPVNEVKPQDIRAFLAHIVESGRTVRTAWTAYVALSSLWSWLNEEFGFPHIVRHVQAPKYQDPVIEILSEDDVRKLLKAAEYTSEADTVGRRRFVMKRPAARRDIAIILVLLDTGLRAGEVGRFSRIL
ncbi:MAG: site-specific integrase [Anaerolineae bacterium]|nr:site-specific integrase [Anaerolineae bacterium]